MKYFSTFSGAGGFELGIEYANTAHKHEWQCNHKQSCDGSKGKCECQLPTCIGFSEIDKHASAVLRYRFPNIPNYGDISKVDWASVPDFDLLVGGSPCQDLSVAGKRAGLEGQRSGLFHEYVKALHIKKPQYFIWENVKGALSSNEGRDFAEVISAFSEAGYSLWWQVLNAKDFGVPQNRERIFVVGVRDGSPREILFEREGDAISDVFHDRAQQTTAPTLRANHHNTADVHFVGELPRIRRLTPRECERLMSWPDDWTALGDYGDGPVSISDTQRYKMCGNGVVSKVVQQVVEKLLL